MVDLTNSQKKALKDELDWYLRNLNKLTTSNIKTLRDKLDICSDYYYNTDEEIIKDKKFDILWNKVNEIFNLESGALPSSKMSLIVEHKIPSLVGTVEKIKLDEFKNWLNNKIKKYDYMTHLLFSRKEDGISVTRYPTDNKKEFLWLTRGKNGLGADVSKIFNNKDFKIDKEFNNYAIKFEAVMTNENLKKYCKEVNKEFNNGRSAVAGILSNKNGYKYGKYITLIILDIIDINNSKKKINVIDRMSIVNDIAKSSTDNIKKLKSKLFSLNDKLLKIDKIMDYFIENRNTIDWMADGIVIELTRDDKDYPDIRRDDKSDYQCAIKFPSDSQLTKVVNIHYSFTGHTGIIIPVVEFEPIYFNGNKCTMASISNYNRFRKLKLAKGDTVSVKYSNDVLCYIEKVVKRSGNEVFKFIKTCPYCLDYLDLDKDENFIMCHTHWTKCRGKKLGLIKNWLKKNDIKGIKEATIADLFEYGVVQDIPDFYSNKFRERLFGYTKNKQKKEINIMNAVYSKLKFYDYEILGAIGIEDISINIAKLVCKKYSLNDLINNKIAISDLIKIKGIKENTAEKILIGIEDKKKIINKLLDKNKCNIEIIESNKSFDENDKEKKVCFTGFRDKLLEKKFEEKGYKVTSGVSKNTTLLVMRDINSKSTKAIKAKELNIPIISEDDTKAGKFN